jgi:hypothetical protein
MLLWELQVVEDRDNDGAILLAVSTEDAVNVARVADGDWWGDSVQPRNRHCMVWNSGLVRAYVSFVDITMMCGSNRRWQLVLSSSLDYITRIELLRWRDCATIWLYGGCESCSSNWDCCSSLSQSRRPRSSSPAKIRLQSYEHGSPNPLRLARRSVISVVSSMAVWPYIMINII